MKYDQSAVAACQARWTTSICRPARCDGRHTLHGFQRLPAADAGKKIKGNKRHIITDILGLMLFIVVHSAAIQDRDEAVDVIKAIRDRHPWLRHLFADSGYAEQS